MNHIDLDELKKKPVDRDYGDGQTLADGVTVGSLVDAEARTVDLRVLQDQQIFDLEMEQIFTRHWVPIAHETEIRNNNDFVSRYIGRDPVIVSRDQDGEIHVSLNACPHRGASVCRVDRGNASRFVCPYHFWTFETNGKLIGVPLEKDMYGDGMDKSKMGLRKARVSVMNGFVFANWDPDAPALEDFIGKWKWYFDLFFKRTKSGLEVAGPPLRWVVKSNWKLIPEQFMGDSQHGAMAHRSVFDSRDVETMMPDGLPVYMKMMWPFSENGMALALANREGAALDVHRTLPPTGVPHELAHEVPEVIDEGQQWFLDKFGSTGGGIFPNFAFAWLGPRPDTSGVLAPRISIPRSPNETEVLVWPLVETDAPPEQKALVRRQTIQDFGSSGMYECDDIDIWGGMQSVTEGAVGPQAKMDFRAVTEFSDPPEEEWPGPIRRKRTSRIQRDDTQWNFWRTWRRAIVGGPQIVTD